MFSVLKAHISRRIAITDDEFEQCTSFFVPKKMRKRQYFLQEGEINRHMAFVNSGCLRAYTIDNKSAEHIVQFAVEDWWISDLHSYLSGMPAAYNIDALQDSEILTLEKNARDRMLEELPKMERFFRLLLENNYIATHKRILDAMSTSAEERYLNFVKTYPAFHELFPQHQVASYLGITPQSLSRIRKGLTKKS